MLDRVRAGMPDLFGQRPAVRILHPSHQRRHHSRRMGARLVAVEPVPDTGHYFSQFRLPPVNVYAGGRSHHTIFIGPHNP
jgi:hypothetical protein